MTTRGQARNAFPAWRIFVFGQEVTDDVTRCSSTFADNNRAPNTAEFVLVNKFDRYIITDTDIAALYADVEFSGANAIELPDEKWSLSSQLEQQAYLLEGFSTERLLIERRRLTSEFAEKYRTLASEKHAEHIDRVVRDRVAAAITDPVKLRVVGAKIGIRQKVSQPNFTVTGTQRSLTPSEFNALRGEAARYPFQQGDCIFHSNDPVRIFWRDPFNPDIWYHQFAGFVTDWVDSVDADNQKLVTVRCEDVTRILRYSRVTTNPGIFDIDAVAVSEQDLTINRSFTEQGFAGLTLVELLYTILWGPGNALGPDHPLAQATRRTLQAAGYRDEELKPHENYSVNGKAASIRFIEGVGGFNIKRSVVHIFGRESERAGADRSSVEARFQKIRQLSEHQAAVDHQVLGTDLETMYDSELDQGDRAATDAVREFIAKVPRDLSTGRPRIRDVIKILGENPHLFPVDGGRLVMLLPGSIGPSTNREIVDKSLIQNIALLTTWRNRLSVIYDTLEGIQFSFYATPRGDLVVEFPLFDFDPDDFGAESVEVSARGGLSALRTTPNVNPGWWTLGADITSGEPTTDTLGPFGPLYILSKKDTISFQRTFSDEKVRTQFKTSPYVVQAWKSIGQAEAIGIPPVVETLRALIPQFGLRAEKFEPPVFIEGNAAAAVYNLIKLSQLNADARTASVDALPRLQFGPNRPILISRRNYIATLRSVTHTLVWNSDMTMSFDVNYIRGWDGSFEVRNGRRVAVYRALGGSASEPMNYKMLFGLSDLQESMKTAPTTSVNPSPRSAGGIVGRVPLID